MGLSLHFKRGTHNKKHTNTNTPTEVRDRFAFSELQELEDVREHLFRGVETPDEVQMFPVRDALVVDQVGDLHRKRQRDKTTLM